MFAGSFAYGQDRWRQAWAALDEWTRDLPDAMTAITTTLTPPPLMEMGTEPLMLVGFAWSSPDHAAGAALTDRLRALASPDMEEAGEVG